MPSTRTWLIVLAALVGVVIACGATLQLLMTRAEETGRFASISVVMPLRIAALVALGAAILVCLPPLAVRSFVAGQRRIGNAEVARVSWVARHEAGVVTAMWLVWGTGLAIAGPALVAGMMRAGFATPGPPGASSRPSDGAPIVPPRAPDAEPTVSEPAPGSAERTGILGAVRVRLATTSRFAVDHLRIAGPFAFVRATEVVPLEGGEEQETDLTFAALLRRGPGNGWQVLELWTLPDDARLPMAEFRRRLGAYQASAGLPAALFPDDLRPAPAGAR